MDPEFWHQRWRTQQIGFHQESPNPLLERWWPSLQLPPGARVYVPFCGKSLDMAWLNAHGHPVVGTEISEIAIREFFAGHAGTVESRRLGPFALYRSGSVELLCGDGFELTPGILGPVQSAYDRAALVALPAAQRARYARQFSELLPSGSKTLLVAFEYPQHLRDGPPFSVDRDEVGRLYDANFAIEELDRVDVLGKSPKFAAAGVTWLHETAYRLTRR